MERKNNLKEIEKEYMDSISAQRNAERKLEEDQLKILSLQEQFEYDLKEFKVLQQKTLALKEAVYEAQKNNFKEMLNIEGFKTALNGVSPLFSKIRNTVSSKAKEVKEYVDGTASDRKWVQERYEEYKEICTKKGEDYKSKEEFEKIALALKEVEDDVGALNLKHVLGKAYKEVGNAKDSFKNVWISLGVENKISNLFHNKEQDVLLLENQQTEQEEKKSSTQENIVNDIIENKFNKKSALELWILENNIQITSKCNTSIVSMYKDYNNFLESKFGNNIPDILYSDKNGAFASALNRHFKKLVYNKDTQMINISYK